MIETLLTEAPEILTAVEDRYGTVPNLIEDLATLTANVIETAQSEVTNPSVRFRKSLAALRGQVETLRDSNSASWEKNVERLIKAINNIIKEVQQLSPHLE